MKRDKIIVKTRPLANKVLLKIPQNNQSESITQEKQPNIINKKEYAKNIIEEEEKNKKEEEKNKKEKENKEKENKEKEKENKKEEKYNNEKSEKEKLEHVLNFTPDEFLNTVETTAYDEEDKEEKKEKEEKENHLSKKEKKRKIKKEKKERKEEIKKENKKEKNKKQDKVSDKRKKEKNKKVASPSPSHVEEELKPDKKKRKKDSIVKKIIRTIDNMLFDYSEIEQEKAEIEAEKRVNQDGFYDEVKVWDINSDYKHRDSVNLSKPLIVVLLLLVAVVIGLIYTFADML